MKRTISIIAACLLILACVGSGSSKGQSDQQDPSKIKTDSLPVTKPNQNTVPVKLNRIFALSEAQRILGEKAKLTDSTTKRSEKLISYQCSYTALAHDAKTSKTGNVYFLIEQYKEVTSAEKKYGFIRTANDVQQGFKILDNLGDEAYFHSDGTNFYFVMARKDLYVISIKVNKITSKTSLDEFNAIAKQIADSL